MTCDHTARFLSPATFSRAARGAGATLGAIVALLWAGPAAHAQESDAEARAAAAMSQDGIKIDVRIGARRVLIPMAVPNVLPTASDDAQLAELVQTSLRRNLELSGYFSMIPADSLFFDASKEGMAASDINFQNWFNVGAQGLVKSAIKRQGDNVQLDLRLYTVDKGRAVTLKWDSKPGPSSDVRGQVNDFVNAVVEFYTGERGIFGSRIAYTQRLKGGLKQVYVMDMDGSASAAVTTSNSINMLPSWGGGALYYTSYLEQNPDLWVYRNGSHKKLSSRRGQNTGGAYCNGQLAVTLSMGGENADIYLLNPQDGQILKRLTDHWGIDTSPTWSPDCSQIAFVSSRSGGPQIYVMKGDGSGQRRLTFQGSYNTSPDWSPKGDVIAFSARDERNQFDIFTVNLQGTIERLTQNQGNNEEPSFSPDGRYVVFSSDRGGKGKRLWLMSHDGQVQNLLTTEGSGYNEPAWSR